jgi:hypothetical protein
MAKAGEAEGKAGFDNPSRSCKYRSTLVRKMGSEVKQSRRNVSGELKMDASILLRLSEEGNKQPQARHYRVDSHK